MSAGIIVACGISATVAGLNIATTRRLWASPIFERPQKIAQTVLLWVLPGSFLIVRRVLGDHLPGRAIGGGESTVSNDGLTSYEGEMGGHGGHGYGGGGGGADSVGGD